MPKIYEYLGITFFFWSDEHEPIHVHGRYQGAEIKGEIIIFDGKISEIKIKNVFGKKGLIRQKEMNLKILLNTTHPKL